jgi:hypothetical protein
MLDELKPVREFHAPLQEAALAGPPCEVWGLWPRQGTPQMALKLAVVEAKAESKVRPWENFPWSVQSPANVPTVLAPKGYPRAYSIEDDGRFETKGGSKTY